MGVLAETRGGFKSVVVSKLSSAFPGTLPEMGMGR